MIGGIDIPTSGIYFIRFSLDEQFNYNKVISPTITNITAIIYYEYLMRKNQRKQPLKSAQEIVRAKDIRPGVR